MAKKKAKKKAMKKRRAATAKQPARKRSDDIIWEDDQWQAVTGKMVPKAGRQSGTNRLFQHVAEKIPFDALAAVRKEFLSCGWPRSGVYIAHDSMGFARYVGRGKVFSRLAARYRAHPSELSYFSIYIVKDKKHEREIETIMIRLGGAHLQFNEKKKRNSIEVGSVYDYEVGTQFVQRRKRRKKKKSSRKKIR